MKWKDADFKNGIETIRAVLIYGIEDKNTTADKK